MRGKKHKASNEAYLKELIKKREMETNAFKKLLEGLKQVEKERKKIKK
jgi:argininosuccinate lyase